MTIIVKFFASLREQVGIESTTFTHRDGVTPADLWREAVPDRPLPSNALVAVNMDYAAPDQPVADGDEVAFFPPVTGGAA